MVNDEKTIKRYATHRCSIIDTDLSSAVYAS